MFCTSPPLPAWGLGEGRDTGDEKHAVMRPLFSMWSNTRMVVLMALSAALYAAILIPFKFATVIPGLTEIRPGACIPVVTGVLFGPAACWGAGLGNLIGDVVGGMFGPGSVWGFAGNFLLAFVAWKLTEAFSLEDETGHLRAKIGGWALMCVTASAACALVLGWGLDMMGLVPFAFLGVVALLNNALVSLVLGPVLLSVLMPRATRWGLRYRAVMHVPPDVRPRLLPCLVLIFAAIGGFGAVLLYSTQALHVAILDQTGVTQSAGVTWGGLPFVALIVLSMLLL